MKKFKGIYARRGVIKENLCKRMESVKESVLKVMSLIRLISARKLYATSWIVSYVIKRNSVYNVRI